MNGYQKKQPSPYIAASGVPGSNYAAASQPSSVDLYSKFGKKHTFSSLVTYAASSQPAGYSPAIPIVPMLEYADIVKKNRVIGK